MRRLRRSLGLALVPVVSAALAAAAPPWPFPWPEDKIARYTARRARGAIAVDGRLDEADWKAAERSPRFSDLIRGAPGIHDTRAAVLWDAEQLYVALIAQGHGRLGTHSLLLALASLSDVEWAHVQGGR